MLDDDHGVAEIAQPPERLEQPVVVALVEADRGLVEDVEHARQARADLAGEADALALAARQRAAGAVEVEIVEPDIVEEAEPLDDLLEDALGDPLLLVGELVGERGEPGERVGRPSGGWTCVMSSPAILTASASGLRRAPWQVSHGARLWYLLSSSRIQALSVWSMRRLRLPITPSNGLLHVIALAAVDEGERDRLAAGAVEDDRCTSPGRSFHGVSRLKPNSRARLPSTCM